MSDVKRYDRMIEGDSEYVLASDYDRLLEAAEHDRAENNEFHTSLSLLLAEIGRLEHERDSLLAVVEVGQAVDWKCCCEHEGQHVSWQCGFCDQLQNLDAYNASKEGGG